MVKGPRARDRDQGPLSGGRNQGPRSGDCDQGTVIRVGYLIWKDCKPIRKGRYTWHHILAYEVDIVIVLIFGWLTLNRVQFESKHIRVVLPGRIFGLSTSKNFDITDRKITPGDIWPGVQGLSKLINCDRTQATLLVEVKDSETAQVVRRIATQVPHFGTRRSRLVAVTVRERQPRSRDQVRNFI